MYFLAMKCVIVYAKSVIFFYFIMKECTTHQSINALDTRSSMQVTYDFYFFVLYVFMEKSAVFNCRICNSVII